MILRSGDALQADRLAPWQKTGVRRGRPTLPPVHHSSRGWDPQCRKPVDLHCECPRANPGQRRLPGRSGVAAQWSAAYARHASAARFIILLASSCRKAHTRCEAGRRPPRRGTRTDGKRHLDSSVRSRHLWRATSRPPGAWPLATRRSRPMRPRKARGPRCRRVALRGAFSARAIEDRSNRPRWHSASSRG